MLWVWIISSLHILKSCEKFRKQSMIKCDRKAGAALLLSSSGNCHQTNHFRIIQQLSSFLHHLTRKFIKNFLKPLIIYLVNENGSFAISQVISQVIGMHLFNVSHFLHSQQIKLGCWSSPCVSGKLRTFILPVGDVTLTKSLFCLDLNLLI